LSADTYINLFAEGSASNIFSYYDPSRTWEIANTISVPLIAFSGTKDDGIEPVMEPQAAMKLLEQQLTRSPRVKTVVFDGAEHSFKGFETQIVDRVSDFVRQG
jgi:hypothetical protein